MSCQNLQVRFKALDKALVLFNLLREVFEQLVLQTILLALVVGFHQLQAGYLYIQIHTLFDTGVSGTQSLDLGKGKRCFIHIIAGAHRRFRGHDLADEFLLILHRLPEVCVKGSFGHIAVHMNKGILVALALDTALALGKVSRSFFADSSIHACLFRSLLLRLLSFDFSLCIFLAQAGQYFDMPERGTYSTPHTVQFLGFNAVHRFVGVICNSPTKPMNL